MLKLLTYLKPYRGMVTATLLLLLMQVIAELYLPTLMANIVDVGVVQGDTSYIIKAGMIMLSLTAAGGMFAVISIYLSSKVAMGFARDLRQEVFAKVEEFSQIEFNTIGTATLIIRTTNDITQVQQVVVMLLRMMVRAPLMCVGGIIMAVSMDGKLSLILIAVLPVLFAALYYPGYKGIGLYIAIQKKLDKLNLVLRENLMGIRVIRAFNRANYENNRYKETNRDLTDSAIQVNRLMAVVNPLTTLLMNMTMIAIIGFGSKRIDLGYMQVGDMMAFIQYATQIMFSLVMASTMFMMIPRASVSAGRINEILNTRPAIHDPDKAACVQISEGRIVFEQVSFSYPGAEQAVLHELSFDVNPGETTAIIGGTGSGKTTLINLIPRLFDATSGRILIDGIDVRDYSLSALRSKLGLVPQKAALFTGTIADNIRYGNDEASDDEIKYAAEVAQIHGFIADLKDGYHTLIAQAGKNFSGGQKQRLAMARALVRKPLIYLFDDSFSALDFKTDAALRAALKNETLEATVIIVAQRVGTIMDADRIIVLEKGRIVGSGNHKELLESCDVYREIVASQLSEEELA